MVSGLVVPHLCMSVVVDSVGTDTAGTDTAGADGGMEDKQDAVARSNRRHLREVAHQNTAVAHPNTAVAHPNTAGVDQQLEPLTALYDNRVDLNTQMFAAYVIV
jgi:hypothetical protein